MALGCNALVSMMAWPVLPGTGWHAECAIFGSDIMQLLRNLHKALPFNLLILNRIVGMCRETKSSSLFSLEAVKCSFKKRAAKCFRYAGNLFHHDKLFTLRD